MNLDEFKKQLEGTLEVEKVDSPLQRQYDRQLQFGRGVHDLSKFVAWTWMAGRERKHCPPLVFTKEVRLLVMDRFPLEADGFPKSIGLTMFKPTLLESGKCVFANTSNVAMFKDFNFRPYPGAGKYILNSANVEVFRQALALDKAIRLASKQMYPTVDTFVPPPILVGFATYYVPLVEWTVALKEELVRVFHPSSAPLQCLFAPAGIITDVSTDDLYNKIIVERYGHKIEIALPVWIKLAEHIAPRCVLEKNQRLGEIPRGEYQFDELVNKFSVTTLEWLAARVLEEKAETHTVQEIGYDEKRTVSAVTYKTLPLALVPGQLSKAVRPFFDFRGHLGRHQNSVLRPYSNQTRIDIKMFAERPKIEDCLFKGPGDSWEANLIETKDVFPWFSRTAYRGT